MDRFDEYLKRVVEETQKHGGTASKPETMEFLPPRDVWSFPKYPSRTAILPPRVDLKTELRAFILRNEMKLNEDDCWLGTWIHPQTREYYLDVATGVVDVNEARRLAGLVSIQDGRNIVAMFNSQRDETIFLQDDTA